MKRAIFFAAVAAAVFISGCAGEKEFLKAQADSITAQSNARVAEAQQKSEEARAVIAVAAKLDAGGAAAYVLGLAFKGVGNQAPVAAVTVQRPRDWLDYMNGLTAAVGAIGNIATPIVLSREAGKTARAGFDRDVRVEEARQGGESSRVTSVAQIARDVAANQPTPSNTTTTYTLSGTGVLGSGTYTGPVSTTTTRTCSGGTGASGGAGGAAGPTAPGGGGAAGGAAPGGSC